MILDFGKHEKIQSTESHNKIYSSNAEAAGTYVPNMSKKAMLKWKAKRIGGDDPRVEIRKTVEGSDPALAKALMSRGVCAAQVLLIVRRDRIIMSANSRMVWDNKTWDELQQAVKEAQQALNE